MTVHIATPSYSNTVSVPYLQTMLELNMLNDFQFSYHILPGDSLVTRSRNTLFSEYVASRHIRGNTHLLWIDDDIGFEAGGLATLLNRHKDVSGIAVPIRRHNRDHGINCAVEGALREIEPQFYEVSRLGCGIMMWSNDAVDALVDYCREHHLTYNNTAQDIEFFDLFQVGALNGYYLSEDYVVCEILKGLGFSIYVDSSIACVHSQTNDQFVREAMDIDPRAFVRGPRGPLPVEDQNRFWTPADYVLGLQ